MFLKIIELFQSKFLLFHRKIMKNLILFAILYEENFYGF